MFLNVKKLQSEKPILYGLNTMSAPFGVTLKAEDIMPNSDLRRALLEGMFVADVAGTVRLLPRTRTSVTTVADTNTITVKSPCGQFKVGDALYLYGVARVGFSGAIASGDRVTLMIESTDYTVTATGGTTLANLGALFVSTHAEAISANQGAVIYPNAAGTGMVVVGTDNYKIQVTASGNGTSTASSALTISCPTRMGRDSLPIGTIQSIAAESPTKTRVITLAANIPNNISTVITANSIVGTAVTRLIGIVPDALDLTDEPRKHVAPITAADGVYKRNLPYIDEGIVEELSDLHINAFFYK